VLVREDGGIATGVNEKNGVILREALLTDVIDHSGRAFAGVDWIEYQAFGTGKEANSLNSAIGRHAIALADIVAVIDDVVGFDARVKAERREVLRRATPDDIERIVQAQRHHDAAVDERDPKTAFRANIIFHQTFFSTCGNAELTGAINLYGQRAHVVRSFSMAQPDYLPRSRDEHWVIIEALKARNEQKLVTVCRDHIRAAPDAYVASYRHRFPGQSAP
jgi:hypothetical protein